jgi:hypothetical protein
MPINCKLLYSRLRLSISLHSCVSPMRIGAKESWLWLLLIVYRLHCQKGSVTTSFAEVSWFPSFLLINSHFSFGASFHSRLIVVYLMRTENFSKKPNRLRRRYRFRAVATSAFSIFYDSTQGSFPRSRSSYTHPNLRTWSKRSCIVRLLQRYQFIKFHPGEKVEWVGIERQDMPLHQRGLQGLDQLAIDTQIKRKTCNKTMPIV